MAGLILRKEEFFPSATQAVAVADRYPQNVFAEHTHEFCELVLVWRGNGLHVLNDRPWRITRGDLFYIRAEDKHSYDPWPLRHAVEAPLAHGQHRYGAGASGD